MPNSKIPYQFLDIPVKANSMTFPDFLESENAVISSAKEKKCKECASDLDLNDFLTIRRKTGHNGVKLSERSIT